MSGQLPFEPADLAGGVGLWVTDGTASGTQEIGGFLDQQIADAGSTGLNPGAIVNLGNGKALFVGQDAAGATSLWPLAPPQPWWRMMAMPPGDG